MDCKMTTMVAQCSHFWYFHTADILGFCRHVFTNATGTPVYKQIFYQSSETMIAKQSHRIVSFVLFLSL